MHALVYVHLCVYVCVRARMRVKLPVWLLWWWEVTYFPLWARRMWVCSFAASLKHLSQYLH